MQVRYWYNAAAISRHYLIPGSITIIMTVIGAMLTSLVVAREWERGTMEALLASPVTRTELLLSKLLPYYVLGMISMSVVALSAVHLMGVPFRGSVGALLLVTTVFLLSMLGIGSLSPRSCATSSTAPRRPSTWPFCRPSCSPARFSSSPACPRRSGR
jgi:ABC-type multidrug transport system, permease component